MKTKHVDTMKLISGILLLILHIPVIEILAQADEKAITPVAWWKFNSTDNRKVTDNVSSISDTIKGNYKYVKGVSGEALKLDGFTTNVQRKAREAPKLSGSFSMEAWVAIAAYPWNWCPILAQEKNETTGYFFGIGPQGHVGLFASIDHSWQKCISEQKIPLKKWIHVSASFENGKEVKIFIDGELSGELKTTGKFTPASNMDLIIGMNRKKVMPSDPVRSFGTLPAWFSFDGIYDEIKIYDQVLTEEFINEHVQDMKPSFIPDIPERVMPSGPAGPGEFGAYYTNLKYYEEWDALWRVGPHSDIVVQFDNSPIRVVFWRGTRYSPAWVMENGQWMADQSAEAFDRIDGCYEHMIDPHCEFSHVRIIENTDARVVIHWRYIPVSIRRNFSQVDPVTGWKDCVDEYYYFYPDGIGIRKVVQHTKGKPLGPSEAIVLCQPGTSPEDNIHLDAMTLVNLKGEHYTYSWADGPPKFKPGENPPDPVVQIVNLKSENKPFMIYEKGNRMSVFGIEQREDVSHFPWWNHWPVAQNLSDGRYCQAADRASHFSLAWGGPPYHKEGDTYWSAWIYGASKQPPEELAGLARSWNNPPTLELINDKVINKGYDLTQRAYILENRKTSSLPGIEIKFNANEDSPLENICLVLKGWEAKHLSIVANQKILEAGTDYRLGRIHTLEGEDLIIWISMASIKPTTIQVDFQ